MQILPISKRFSFLSGAARLLDIFGVFDEGILPLSDEEYLSQDWQAIGRDLFTAIAEVTTPRTTDL